MVTQKTKKCSSCNSSIRSHTKSGYCASCFHKNVDGVKSKYNASRWKSGEAKLSHWSFRGAILTEKDVEDFNLQNKCGICGGDFSLSKKCLDHCHETGAYRGALCVQCNAALGKLGDDLDLVMSRLQAYAKRRSREA